PDSAGAAHLRCSTIDGLAAPRATGSTWRAKMRLSYGKSAGIIGLAALALGAGLLLVACAKKPDQAAVHAAAAASWTKFVDEWIESALKAQPLDAVYQGRHEYDGLFPDWSEAGLAAETQRLKDWQAKTTTVDPATLPDAARFERDYLLALLDKRLFWRETVDW